MNAETPLCSVQSFITDHANFRAFKDMAEGIPEISESALAVFSELQLEVPSFLQISLAKRVSFLEIANQDYEDALARKRADQRSAYCKVVVATGACFSAVSCISFFMSAMLIKGAIAKIAQTGTVVSLLPAVFCGGSVIRQGGGNDRAIVSNSVPCCFAYSADTEGYPFMLPDYFCSPCNVIEEARFLIPHKIEKKRFRVIEREESLKSTFESIVTLCDTKKKLALQTILQQKVEEVSQEYIHLWKKNCEALQEGKRPPLVAWKIVELERHLDKFERTLKELNALITHIQKNVISSNIAVPWTLADSCI